MASNLAEVISFILRVSWAGLGWPGLAWAGCLQMNNQNTGPHDSISPLLLVIPPATSPGPSNENHLKDRSIKIALSPAQRLQHQHFLFLPSHGLLNYYAGGVLDD